MRVRKFPIAEGRSTVCAPAPAEPVYAGLDERNRLCVWLKCFDGERDVERAYLTVRTGEEFEGGEYVGSVRRPFDIWHIFREARI